ncbi:MULTISPECIES: hypothetical protein [unclassified Janthinobacterium]|uniref:hypothetical protein n=1 Tax=unclassified Janthinobacterium TaxID=2610881 RepID=UPI00160E495D|nr:MULTISPECIES: hypothetical protein [unclassified Janthinobacterium]MBB5606380.1 hypothetical protein [Janthinobacterium sp. S3T4]MBB5611748.1 hypothetical protein [Janthinobacterium sp. S3M3]
MNSTMKIFSITAVVLLTLASSAGSAFAGETAWQKQHPRREQVNHRLANQDRRIHKEVKEGEISKTQASALHSEDRSIRGEEKTMAGLDGSHITKADQHSLNQQENAVSKQIGK